MKAWRINELGKPPVMEEVPIPEPTFGEILIKMKGAGMCRTGSPWSTKMQVRL